MTGLPLVIGIAGAKRSGKDTLARHFVETHGYERKSFADPLKAMALQINPIVLAGTFGGPDGTYTARLMEAVEDMGWERAKEELPEVRRFLQRLGSEGVRGTFGPRAWVDLAFPIDKPTVIPDVRFPEEVEAILGEGRGVAVRVIRPGFSGDGHQSEHALDDLDLPVVYNVDSVEALWRHGENVIRRETRA